MKAFADLEEAIAHAASGEDTVQIFATPMHAGDIRCIEDRPALIIWHPNYIEDGDGFTCTDCGLSSSHQQAARH